MGILRTDRVAGLGGANAITGSVNFTNDGATGTGDYLRVDRKDNSKQYNSVVKELRKRDSFLLIVTPEGRFDADRFRTSFLYIARELNAEVMPVQIDYENQIFNILESFEIDGDIEDVIKKLRIKFDGIKGKKSRFKA